MTTGTLVEKGAGTKLEARAVYLAPSGRRCRWWPGHTRFAQAAPWAILVYDLQDGRPASSAMSDGFTLSPANFHLLRRVS